MGLGAPNDLSDCRRFFLEPANSKQRMYEALRAYFIDELPSAEVALAFNYSPGSFQVLCHHFRRDADPNFKQRMYEALRAYFIDELPSAEVALAFNYSPGSFQVLCHHFRRDADPNFFVSTRPGPRSQPKKSAARDLIVRLRKQNPSVYEISDALKEQQCPLSPTAVREVLKRL